VTADVLELAQAGDGEAFRQLIGPYERELRVHCYRMLGSEQDAEDAMQDALLAAWQNLAGFEGRASIRTWLYRVVTSRCLNARRSASRRAGPVQPPAALSPPEPTRRGEVFWLEPYLEDVPDAEPGPEARYDSREAISLAFIVAMQKLPARQRAALILRDALGYPAAEAAAILGVTEESVTSALKRARGTLKGTFRHDPPPEPDSAEERRLVERLTRAYEAGDVPGLIALFSEDAWLSMPPMELEYQGRDLIGAFMSGIAFRNGRRFQLAPTRANGQLAFWTHLVVDGVRQDDANDLIVLTQSGGLITAMTRFPGTAH
jgi:RNA polymerase sigma-70 factor (TIGR02960 family)